jgi:aminoglycoside 6'-N-acetyltransferase
MAATYGFTRVTRDDFPTLMRWMSEPHVARWWGDVTSELAALAHALDGPGFDAYLVNVDGRPFAYLQVYDPFADDDNPYRDQPRGTRGLDLYIGDESMTGCGHGPAMLSAMAERLFAAGHPRLLIDPDPANRNAIRAYEKAGFRPLGVRRVVVAGAGDVAVVLMTRDRNESM